MKTMVAFLLLGLVLVHSQFADPIVIDPDFDFTIIKLIEGHYGRCCHVQYVFSVDVSGSMFPYQSSTNTLLAGWKSWLVSERTTGEDYWVSAHMFNHLSTVFNNNMIHRAPFHWVLPPHNPSGGTNWSLAIQFLTLRLALKDHICYTLITDLHPDYIYIDGAIANAFAEAAKKHATFGCSFYFRVIDVRSLPQYKALAAGTQE